MKCALAMNDMIRKSEEDSIRFESDTRGAADAANERPSRRSQDGFRQGLSSDPANDSRDNGRHLLIYKRKEKKSHLFNIRNVFFPVKTQRVTLSGVRPVYYDLNDIHTAPPIVTHGSRSRPEESLPGQLH
jgi:hypothetical protein